ncbi:Uma2 family endonuclease [Streptomyces sp. VRA16 Mangrove soil]|uniref:Uma2 family endonuclease n=1 Tax=Streptomyces sp. VRA16 Mangrove soil TaxID=2817434 RepID=UPI001A9F24EA|nr:Uma2 family endonuclease [Streptomyces sp. VRA16 Mangrove soil]MBO1333611.1 Uma2 family endonuclease [Streptomyces sp. VRA16 Mangrove soil]
MAALPVPEHHPVGPGHVGVPDVEEAFTRVSAAAPEGWRVELIEGEIHVTPPANGEHEEFVTEASDQITLRRLDRTLRSYTGIGLNVPGASATGHVVPDIVVAPKGSFDNDLEWHEPSAVLMVVEVTSDSTAGNDRFKKIRGYARAAVPLYLLIDREAKRVTLGSVPEGDDYAKKTSYKLGLAVPLPDPLGFDLDTAEF